jgi:D-alanyl-D-alanine carboxypeptidase
MAITKQIITLITGTLLSSFTFGQTFNKAKMDSLFNALETNNKAMGSICITKDGKDIYSRAIGYSQIDAQSKIKADVKADINTKYRIGSISKMFTATLIFQLIDEKKITLSDKLDKYFPELPNAAKITMEQLLGHRSGIHNFTNDEAYGTYMEQPKSQKEMLEIITKGGTDFEPDSKAEYSNSNYVILGYIIEKITNKPYAEVLKQKITAKTGLKNTYCGTKISAAKKESSSYQYLNQWNVMPETDMSIPGGAGAVVSTPADLDKFIEALFNGKLISEASLNHMTTIKEGHGLGIFQFPFGTTKAYGHDGSIDGFNSMLGYFPEDKLAIAYCSNGVNYNVNNIVVAALSIYYNKEYTIPSFKALNVTAEQLSEYTGLYSSKEMPLKITVSKDGNTLTAQATGQGAFPLEATEKNIFKFDAADITLEFNPDKKEMTLKQGPGKYLFIKE